MKTMNNDKKVYKDIINGVIVAKSGSDLKLLLDIVYSTNWLDGGRQMFLIGLLQGSLMQFKKDVSVEELKNLFMEY